ncbi:uncharacterized protein LOC116349213 isoform X1 [Contarinia nasturtii]|uniref:uncharacterized protein LOC116349213 isoform X1 n=1 Tax=Contarinia nasturtii TaxID=265458 RepID=UPI0012D37B4C|nr:uncharacterized protein LOC116349213 isoform X1 [Contarinia nasturtii]
MNRTMFWSLFSLFIVFYLKVVFCGKSSLLSIDNMENDLNAAINRNDGVDSLLDTGKVLKRDKRYLLWIGGGISKIVLGFLAPVETRDRVNWRTLNLAYNFQAQYVAIPNATFLWNRFTRDLRTQKKLYDQKGVYTRDLTRDLIYGALTLFLDSKGKPGRQCLLKSICDAAEHPIVRRGVFEEIIHLILTPSMDEVINDDYKNARMAGEQGADCARLYGCPFGDGFLDKFSYLTHE